MAESENPTSLSGEEKSSTSPRSDLSEKMDIDINKCELPNEEDSETSSDSSVSPQTVISLNLDNEGTYPRRINKGLRDSAGHPKMGSVLGALFVDTTLANSSFEQHVSNNRLLNYYSQAPGYSICQHIPNDFQPRSEPRMPTSYMADFRRKPVSEYLEYYSRLNTPLCITADSLAGNQSSPSLEGSAENQSSQTFSNDNYCENENPSDAMIVQSPYPLNEKSPCLSENSNVELSRQFEIENSETTSETAASNCHLLDPNNITARESNENQDAPCELVAENTQSDGLNDPSLQENNNQISLWYSDKYDENQNSLYYGEYDESVYFDENMCQSIPVMQPEFQQDPYYTYQEGLTWQDYRTNPLSWGVQQNWSAPPSLQTVGPNFTYPNPYQLWTQTAYLDNNPCSYYSYDQQRMVCPCYFCHQQLSMTQDVDPYPS